MVRAHGKGVSVSGRCFTLNRAQVNEIARAAGIAGRKEASGERLVFGDNGVTHGGGANLGHALGHQVFRAEAVVQHRSDGFLQRSASSTMLNE